MNIFLDIETIPAQPEEETKAIIAESIQAPSTMSKAETINDWHNGQGKYAGAKDAAIEKAYRDTSFNGAEGRIISSSFATDSSDPAVFFGDYQSDDEAKLINNLFSAISETLKRQAHSTQPYFIGQFIAGFDLKFLFHRCVVLGIKPPFPLPFSGRHEKDFYCTQQAWAGFNGRMSQASLCKALGIEGKPDDIDGSKVWDFVKAGDVARVAEYNRDDVEKVRAIYQRINFITSEEAA
jgi:3'-5' exonuclease